MARVLYVEGIVSVRGALDSVKEGQAKRARWISRLRWQGEKSIASNGSLWHELYLMRMHEGPWSDGATRNREMIKAAQRMAHDIERICYHPEEFTEEDIAQAKIWQEKYAEYRAGFPADSKQHKHFYGWMFSEIYRCIRQNADVCQT